jgi:hypothetical protein
LGPECGRTQPPCTGKIVAFPEVGALHHRYELASPEMQRGYQRDCMVLEVVLTKSATGARYLQRHFVSKLISLIRFVLQGRVIPETGISRPASSLLRLNLQEPQYPV